MIIPENCSCFSPLKLYVAVVCTALLPGVHQQEGLDEPGPAQGFFLLERSFSVACSGGFIVMLVNRASKHCRNHWNSNAEGNHGS